MKTKNEGAGWTSVGCPAFVPAPLLSLWLPAPVPGRSISNTTEILRAQQAPGKQQTPLITPRFPRDGPDASYVGESRSVHHLPSEALLRTFRLFSEPEAPSPLTSPLRAGGWRLSLCSCLQKLLALPSSLPPPPAPIHALESLYNGSRFSSLPPCGLT